MNNIALLVQRCQEKGSYRHEKAQVSPIFLAQKLLTLVAQWSSPGKGVEPGITEYPDHTGVYRVVYIRFFVNVTYEARPYLIWCQIILPPAFPTAPPLFSLLNTDHQRFQPNPLFAANALPDRSYAVKLHSATGWPQKLSFEELFHEFMQTIHQNFPFHRSSAVNMPTFPSHYDLKYSAALQPDSNLQHFPEIFQEQDMMIREEERIQARIQALQEKVDTRASALENLNINEMIANLRDQIDKLQQSIGGKDEKLSVERVESILSTEKRNEVAMTQLTARQSGCQDTAAFIENCFIENDSTDFDCALKALEKTWKAEFDVILLLKDRSSIVS